MEISEEDHKIMGENLARLSRENQRLNVELFAWRRCVLVNAKMGGAQFNGFSHSEGQRVFNKYWVPPRGSREPLVSEEGTGE